MNKKNLHSFLVFISLALLFYIDVVHIRFVILPVLFLALGLLSYLWSGKKALVLFLFLLPLINSTPDIFFNGYPFNYMAVALFYLSGMALASRWKGEKPLSDFPGQGVYIWFLALLTVSVLFVYLRWSNLTLSPLAFLHDTPVAPSGERLSFACIFPVITLALFSLTPFLASLIRHWHLREDEIFIPLKAGFCLSFLLALAQKWLAPDLLAQSWWGLDMKQVNGGFSDFNAFGFFAGVLFLYQALKLGERLSGASKNAVPVDSGGSGPAGIHGGSALWADLLFLAVALGGVFLSGCRTAFLFVLIAFVHFFCSRRASFRLKAAVGLLIAVSLLLAGGTLAGRLWESLEQAAHISSPSRLYQTADRISNGRLAMLRDSARMTARFPVSGVGAGNFLFYLKYLHHGEEVWLDLPLNQYLLVASETGLPGILLFLLFVAALLKGQRPGTVRFVLAAMAGALLFNNFFWFPEALLLFWLFVALGERPGGDPGRHRPVLGAVVLLAFATLNIVDLRALHPRTWARETSILYDYGFSYRESEGGRTFRWSGEKAGVYIYLGAGGRSGEYVLNCGAPLAALKDRKQSVDIYWRGRLYQSLIFQDNGERRIQIVDGLHHEGFLEIRVQPAFNLARLGLGKETRTLGVQVSGPGW